MVVYKTVSAKGKKVFVYIKLDLEDAKKLFAGIKEYEGTEEFHITTNSSFNTYIEKRKTIPLVVQICDTHEELETRLAVADLYL